MTRAATPRTAAFLATCGFRVLAGLLACASLGLGLRTAHAYNAASTHSGMTERAARAAPVHSWLRRIHRLDQGLFEAVTLAPGRMGRVERWHFVQDLNRLDPTHGYAPDQKLRSRALGWLVSGAALESIPSGRGRHHFLEPGTGKGLHQRAGRWTLSFGVRVLDYLKGDGSVAGLWTGANFDLSGKSALVWASHRHNRYSLPEHWRHRRLAVTSKTRAARRHHLIWALICMGSLSHLLQNMASPSLVRNDFIEAHLRNGAPGGGSAYEAFVASKYGRLGIPAPSGLKVVRTKFDHFFVDPKRHQGLAQITARRFFSPGTVPKPISLKQKLTVGMLKKSLKKSLSYSTPAPWPLDLQNAGAGGAYLAEPTSAGKGRTTVSSGESGIRHLVAYGITTTGFLSFWLDRRCYRDYARILVPAAVRYTAGLLTYLLRGKLAITRTASNTLDIFNRGVELKKGRLIVLVQDARGRRRIVKEISLNRRAPRGRRVASLPAPRLPKGGLLVAVFTGADAHGQQLVAEGVLAK